MLKKPNVKNRKWEIQNGALWPEVNVELVIYQIVYIGNSNCYIYVFWGIKLPNDATYDTDWANRKWITQDVDQMTKNTISAIGKHCLKNMRVAAGISLLSCIEAALCVVEVQS